MDKITGTVIGKTQMPKIFAKGSFLSIQKLGEKIGIEKQSEQDKYPYPRIIFVVFNEIFIVWDHQIKNTIKDDDIIYNLDDSEEFNIYLNYVKSGIDSGTNF